MKKCKYVCYPKMSSSQCLASDRVTKHAKLQENRTHKERNQSSDEPRTFLDIGTSRQGHKKSYYNYILYVQKVK